MIRKALLATALLVAVDALERRILGHRPAYDVNRIGRRLFGSPGKGWALRCAYGPAMAFLQTRLRLPALMFGPLLAAAELYAMPRLGATPSPSKWPKGEVPLLFAHSTAFALAVNAL
jgi:hypothetical protein